MYVVINHIIFYMKFFLSLIKMMYWISKENGENLTLNQLLYCLMRNFGGQTDVNEVVKSFFIKVPANILTTHFTADVKVRDYSLLCNLCYYL